MRDSAWRFQQKSTIPPSNGGGWRRGCEEGVPGELVATSAFPNMPTMSWGNESGKRYHDTYFGRFDSKTNPFRLRGTVANVDRRLDLRRLGLDPFDYKTPHISRACLQGAKSLDHSGFFSQKIADSICVGQRRPTDTDGRVMLFLLMKPGAGFTADLVNRIKKAIRCELSTPMCRRLF